MKKVIYFVTLKVVGTNDENYKYVTLTIDEDQDIDTKYSASIKYENFMEALELETCYHRKQLIIINTIKFD
jgi:hypothetical protein